MKQLEQFWESVKKEEVGLLATSSNGNVTMKTAFRPTPLNVIFK